MLGISRFDCCIEVLNRSHHRQGLHAKHLHCCWSSCHTPFLLRTSPKFDCCLHHVLSQLLVVVTPLNFFPSGDWQPPALSQTSSRTFMFLKFLPNSLMFFHVPKKMFHNCPYSFTRCQPGNPSIWGKIQVQRLRPGYSPAHAEALLLRATAFAGKPRKPRARGVAMGSWWVSFIRDISIYMVMDGYIHDPLISLMNDISGS